MVGGDGVAPGYAITTVGATEEVRRRPDLGKDGVLTFNVGNTTDISGDYVCCEGSPYPDDADAIVRRLELQFDYLDATFTVPATAGPGIAGQTYTVRLVHVVETTVTDINGSTADTVILGDRLVRGPGDNTFRWCDSSGCSHAIRPDSAIVDSSLANGSGDGNPNYATFVISLTNDNSITFTEAEALEGNWIFTVDFDLQDAVRFNIADWTSLNSVQDLVNAFSIGPTSVSVTLTKGKIQ